MIGYLSGKVADCSEGKALIVIPMGGGSPAGAIGYSVTVPLSPAYGILISGKWVELFIYTHVREDALDLYGFLSPIEKDLFLTLLGVTGIGPKGAMGILSGADPSELVRAIIDRDKDFLTGIPGIGKKTAERVVLELADPLKKKEESGALGALVPASGSCKAGLVPSGASVGRDVGSSQLVREAKDALLGLGYREQDMTILLNRLLSENKPKNTEDLIRLALKNLV